MGKLIDLRTNVKTKHISFLRKIRNICKRAMDTTPDKAKIRIKGIVLEIDGEEKRVDMDHPVTKRWLDGFR